MPSPLLVAIRYYAGHRITRVVAGLGLAGILAVGTVGIPAYTDARAAAQEQLAVFDVQIAGQLAAAERADARLVGQIEEAQALVEKAGAKGALPEKNSLGALKTEVADAEAQLAQLDKLAKATEAQQAETDSDAWLPRMLVAEHDELADAFQEFRAQTVAANRIDLAPAADAVRAEMQSKQDADAKAAEAAAAAAEEAAAAAAVEEAAWAASYEASGAGTGGGGGYVEQPASTGGGREVAEALVAQISGWSVVWTDLGVSGMTGAGQVNLFGHEGVVYLSSGTDPAFWATPVGRYIAVHEAAHALTDIRLDRLWAADYTYTSIGDTAETGADCMAAMLGAPGSTYGCDAAGQRLASIVLG